MKNILVTGGAGFIGSNFIRMMLDKYPEYNIINVDALTYAGCLENLTDINTAKNYTFYQADIRNKDEIEAVFNKHSIDVIVNFAAESHVDKSIEEPNVFLMTNTIGTEVLLDVAKKYWKIYPWDIFCKKYKPGTKFIQISTDEVYGTLEEEGMFVETMPLKPNSPYSASKASADMIVRAYYETYGLPINITRCSNNYGPYQFPEKLIPLTINNCLNNKDIPIYGDGMQIRDWLHVLDHCEAIDYVINKGRSGEIYNVGGNNERANIDVVQFIVNILGKPESLIRYVNDRPGHDRRYAIDNSKITTELGWEPSYSFEEGIKGTIRWYQHNEEWLNNRVHNREISKQFTTKSVKEYVKENGLFFKVAEEAKKEYVYEPEYYGFNEKEKRQSVSCPEIYLTELSDVQIIGENSFIIKDNLLLYDMLHLDDLGRFDLKFSSLLGVSMDGVASVKYTESKNIINEGVFLNGFASFNLFHLSIELLTKFRFIEKYYDDFQIPILIDEIVCEVPQFYQLLNMVNKNKRPIIPIKKGVLYNVDTLSYISDCSWMPINLKNDIKSVHEDYMVNSECVKYLRDTVLPQIATGSKNRNKKRRLFISREFCKLKRLLNNEEIKSLLVGFGFEIIYPERLSFKEQVELFSQAELLVSVSGAAVTNIIYTSRDCTFICITPRKYNFHMFSTLAGIVGLKTIFFDANIVIPGKKPGADRFYVDKYLFEKLLNSLGLKVTKEI